MSGRMHKWIFSLTSLILLAGCAGEIPLLETPTISPLSQESTPPDLQTTNPASSPAVNIRFVRIGVARGLSQGVVTSLLQDQLGFIWIGTQDGLNRFDGYEFKVFRPVADDPWSINDRWILSLFQDRKGTIWIGTRLGGLNRYDPSSGRFTHYVNDPSDPTSLINDKVQVVFEDSRSRMWIGTSEGLDRFSATNESFEHLDFNPQPASEPSNDNITAIGEDSQGRIWVGTATAGLNLLDENTGSFINFTYDPDDPASISSNQILAIRANQDGSLWIGTDRGLNLLDPTSRRVVRFNHSPDEDGSLADDIVHSLLVDSQEQLWIGTGDGLDLFDPSGQRFIHYRHDPSQDASLSQNGITSILEGSDGVLWFGTQGSGLNKYIRGQDAFSFYHYSPVETNSLGGNNVTSMDFDNLGRLWIGTLGGGLSQLDPASGQIIRVQNDPENPSSLTSNEVRSVFFDRSGALWVGTNNGLDMRAAASTNFIHFQHNPGDRTSLLGAPVLSITEDGAYNLWLGTDIGLERFNRNDLTFHHYVNEPGNRYSLSGNEIRSLYVDRTGTLWIGTFSDGLNRYESSTGYFKNYFHNDADPGSLSSDSILSLYQDEQGSLWIGTDGGGLNRMDASTDTFTRFGENEGLPNSVIYAILEDDQGYLWLSTNNGISQFDPRLGRSVRNYRVEDGLQGDQFNHGAAARNGINTLFFGGINGLTGFNPEMIHESQFIPPVVILSISQDGLPLDLEITPELVSQVILQWPRRSFEFEYSALSYAQPAMNRYAYKLEGFDPEWNQVGDRRTGRYTNLPGGDYLLRIKASNQDGLWNEMGTSLQVRVIPPFWQANWFRLLVIFGIIAAGFTAYWLRIRSVNSYNLALEQEVRDRTLEIEKLFEKTKELAVVEERNRLARELHDSAKQKAFAALAQLGAVNGMLKNKPLAAKDHLDEAEDLVYEVIEDLTFLIQEMYPLALKERGLAATLREYVFDWESRTDIQAEVGIKDGHPLPLNIEQTIFRVVQEALSNVSRHSRASRVRINLEYSPQAVLVNIEDDGCGFDPQARQKGVGLRSIRERIDTLGGSLEIQSQSDCGTRLTIRLPAPTSE